ncbi:Na(+)/H(+) antiporter subunit C [Streptomyces sp. NPDC014894]|uniref:Na(+)/H(+) antiporter subunit C n=1 Tax=Streptomyces sp. NPDC014894 TaxID=3364931 RepID=UPI0036F538CB
MTVSLSLLVTAGVLCAVGGVLLLMRALSRVLIGAVVLGNGINLLMLGAGGPAGLAPLLYPGVELSRVTDPLPQAIALTAIVITLATTAFLLAMAYRSQRVTGTDEVQDDIEDRRVALRAEVQEQRAALRERHGPRGRGPEGDRDEYRVERRRLRAVLREDRALQARARDASGDLWNDILGEDPEDREDRDEGPGGGPEGRGGGADRGGPGGPGGPGGSGSGMGDSDGSRGSRGGPGSGADGSGGRDGRPHPEEGPG